MRYLDAIFLGKKGAMRRNFDYDAIRFPSLNYIQVILSINLQYFSYYYTTLWARNSYLVHELVFADCCNIEYFAKKCNLVHLR